MIFNYAKQMRLAPLAGHAAESSRPFELPGSGRSAAPRSGEEQLLRSLDSARGMDANFSLVAVRPQGDADRVNAAHLIRGVLVGLTKSLEDLQEGELKTGAQGYFKQFMAAFSAAMDGNRRGIADALELAREFETGIRAAAERAGIESSPLSANLASWAVAPEQPPRATELEEAELPDLQTA